MFVKLYVLTCTTLLANTMFPILFMALMQILTIVWPSRVPMSASLMVLLFETYLFASTGSQEDMVKYVLVIPCLLSLLYIDLKHYYQHFRSRTSSSSAPATICSVTIPSKHLMTDNTIVIDSDGSIKIKTIKDGIVTIGSNERSTFSTVFDTINPFGSIAINSSNASTNITVNTVNLNGSVTAKAYNVARGETLEIAF